MCGINLLIGGDRATADLMMNDIAHRGTRGKVIRAMPDVWLGHRRLPIQGLDDSHDQPVFKREHIMTFVGEIFNFREFEIRAETDSKVLLNQLIKRGLDSLKTLDGFWSVILVNTQTGNIDVITDYLAKKPLYIRHERGMHGVSSEIKPLLRLGPVTLDKLYLSTVMKWGYCIDERTPYNEIQKIPAGHCLRYNTHYPWDGFRAFRYDELKPNNKGSLPHILEKAVINRLVSDTPISLILSGGLDSSIILEFVKKHTTDFTIFHVENDESEYMSYLTIPDEVKVEYINQELSSLKDHIYWNETPVDLGSMSAQYNLGKAVRSKAFDVTISGDGADELFGGYRRAQEYDSQWSDIFHELIYYHLPRLDKLMMANTVELRCPFLNREVIEYALSLPWDQRRKKNHLKRIFGYMLPDKILHREKKPLKNPEIIQDKMQYRKKVMNLFLDNLPEEVTNEC